MIEKDGRPVEQRQMLNITLLKYSDIKKLKEKEVIAAATNITMRSILTQMLEDKEELVLVQNNNHLLLEIVAVHKMKSADKCLIEAKNLDTEELLAFNLDSEMAGIYKVEL